MTPFEIFCYCEAFTSRMKFEQQERVTQAYLTAYLQRVKEMPKLDKLLGKDKEPKTMTDEEMWDKVRALNAQFGGTEVKGGEANVDSKKPDGSSGG